MVVGDEQDRDEVLVEPATQATAEVEGLRAGAAALDDEQLAGREGVGVGRRGSEIEALSDSSPR